MESVSANYIVWEVNGRSDYSFTARMQEVGCNIHVGLRVIYCAMRYCNQIQFGSLRQDFGSALKEYYEIVDEARPLSGFFPTHADFFTEMHF